MAADIERARALQGLLDLTWEREGIDGDHRLGLNEGPCRLCQEHGMIREGPGVRYCLCRTGREKKREWLALPAEDRAPFEAHYPTLPDADDLAQRRRA
jgi:hypothetical protein